MKQSCRRRKGDTEVGETKPDRGSEPCRGWCLAPVAKNQSDPEQCNLENILEVETWRHPYYGLPPLEGLSIAELPSGVVMKQQPGQRHEKGCSVLSFNALFNANAPINRLPTELLVEILLILQEELRYMYPPSRTSVLLQKSERV
ncbi:hypothetical protein BV20DRAFT_583134 [Pilatotrama ljubarskyi]|nr:hypothetical protein BV20DRAFT_583134 [Pilatotrama ljubarskyi]